MSKACKGHPPLDHSAQSDGKIASSQEGPVGTPRFAARPRLTLDHGPSSCDHTVHVKRRITWQGVIRSKRSSPAGRGVGNLTRAGSIARSSC